MRIPQRTIRAVSSCTMLLLVWCAGYGQKSLTRVVKTSDLINSTVPVNTKEGLSEVRLRLVDGSTISVDEAWESEQGIWYRRAGVSHLVPRERVKTIERGSNAKPKPE